MTAPDRDRLTALFDRTVAIGRARSEGRVPVIGIAGSQGSGKSTLAAAIAAERPGTALLSLDDCYRTLAERATLAIEVHPLLRTRGVPGTHDIALLAATLDGLAAGRPTPIPRFDKLADDRLPERHWPVWRSKPALILLEGWCLGATSESDAALAAPINRLEIAEDRDGRWRAYANAELAGPYAAVFARIDALLFLRAPSFDVVAGWRAEQQAGLLGRALDGAETAAIVRFVAHYERITRHMLAGGIRADITAMLDSDRRVTAVVPPD